MFNITLFMIYKIDKLSNTLCIYTCKLQFAWGIVSNSLLKAYQLKINLVSNFQFLNSNF